MAEASATSQEAIEVVADTVDVLWTSGWDSTFRIAQLLLDGTAQVQPWYVRDPDRHSTRIELETLTRLRSAFQADARFHVDRLEPVRIIAKQRIPPEPAITARFQRLLDAQYWGSQYEWLARLAAAQGTRLEIGLKADDEPTRRLARYIAPLAEGVSRFGIDPAISDDELGDLQLFRVFTFPIRDLTKLEMLAIVDREGFRDIMEQTWFCHDPTIRRRPCGQCAPCRHARAEGFGWRVPDPGPVRRVAHRAVLRMQRLARRTITRRDAGPSGDAGTG